jgi:hypothetical protein
MGQPITVLEKPSTANPAIVRFETNRPLSGMAHERYTAPPGPLLDRPVDELARRLFAHGGVSAVHVHGSVVTVTLAPGSTGAGLADVVRGLFLHYPAEGSEPAEGAGLGEEEKTPEMAADPADVTDAVAGDAPGAAADDA